MHLSEVSELSCDVAIAIGAQLDAERPGGSLEVREVAA